MGYDSYGDWGKDEEDRPVFNREFSDAEIQEMYEAEKARLRAVEKAKQPDYRAMTEKYMERLDRELYNNRGRY